jgi:protein-S-isoprenylcysteine O-methyltransferase Ste14
MVLGWFKCAQLAALVVFVWYGFDLRRKQGMVPLVAPWFTRIMKAASCVVVALYLYLLWAIDRLVWADALALLFTGTGAALVRAAKQELGSGHTWTGYCIASPTLVASGIYSYLRHPLYAGVYLFEVGALCTFAPRVSVLPPWAVALGVMCLVYAMTFNATMAAFETRRMARMFGAELEAYRARVRAFIPVRRGMLKTLRVRDALAGARGRVLTRRRNPIPVDR